MNTRPIDEIILGALSTDHQLHIARRFVGSTPDKRHLGIGSVAEYTALYVCPPSGIGCPSLDDLIALSNHVRVSIPLDCSSVDESHQNPDGSYGFGIIQYRVAVGAQNKVVEVFLLPDAAYARDFFSNELGRVGKLTGPLSDSDSFRPYREIVADSGLGGREHLQLVPR